jgi:hypothetical protein
MKRTALIGLFITAGLILSLKSFGQNTDYKNYKSLSKEYLQCLFNNDTSELRKKFIDVPYLVHVVSIGATGKKDSAHVDSLLKKKFNRFLANLYFDPFYKLHKHLERDTIKTGILDSIKLAKMSSSGETKEYMLTIFLKTNAGRKYSLDIDVTETAGMWRIVEVEDYLVGPFGYERTYKGEVLIEEHKIGKDSIITHY